MKKKPLSFPHNENTHSSREKNARISELIFYKSRIILVSSETLKQYNYGQWEVDRYARIETYKIILSCKCNNLLFQLSYVASLFLMVQIIKSRHFDSVRSSTCDFFRTRFSRFFSFFFVFQVLVCACLTFVAGLELGKMKLSRRDSNAVIKL